MVTRCNAKTEVYSRVCGFFRPVQQWNRGKREEFKERREFVVNHSDLEASSEN
ncbi:anaerobic ribonucleoside-triphosphate reductase [Syntrophotalea acetylenica]|uniref:anaerobic ribonucleoside-triphosphate reductase n=1 Tax=Syntrophotalea acetylenica TaxID=29542 RepID=UPI000930FA4E|nr:anaerobic ribonucleoside-triphosphate reductase [Desulfomicrobium apsheronum]